MSSTAVATRAVQVRLALFYASYFTVLGVQMPFWPVWLDAQGVTRVEIGLLMAAGACARVLVTPLVAQSADRSGERRRPMLALAWGSLAVFALFGIDGGFWWLAAVTVAFGLLAAPLLALGESLTMLAARARGFDYGRVRLWGSLAFIAAAAASGWVVEAAGAGVVLWLVIGVLLAQLGACYALPDPRIERRDAGRAPVWQLLARPWFWLLMLATSGVQASHAAYYSFGTLHWQAAGHSDGVIGLLWAEGVIAEILLFACGPALTRRGGAASLIAVGAAAGVLRWTVVMGSDELWVLVLLQPLHALTFGATHLGAVRLISERVPAALSATAQSLHAGVANGAAMGLSMLLAGWIYQAHGAVVFGVMAAGAALGGVAAVALLLSLRRGPAPF